MYMYADEVTYVYIYSSTAVVCWGSRGVDRGSMATAVTVGERIAEITEQFSYDAPKISVMMTYSLLKTHACYVRRRIHACHMRRRIHA